MLKLRRTLTCSKSEAFKQSCFFGGVVILDLTYVLDLIVISIFSELVDIFAKGPAEARSNVNIVMLC